MTNTTHEDCSTQNYPTDFHMRWATSIHLQQFLQFSLHIKHKLKQKATQRLDEHSIYSQKSLLQEMLEQSL
jgi:hypothetical protein